MTHSTPLMSRSVAKRARQCGPKLSSLDVTLELFSIIVVLSLLSSACTSCSFGCFPTGPLRLVLLLPQPPPVSLQSLQSTPAIRQTSRPSSVLDSPVHVQSTTELSFLVGTAQDCCLACQTNVLCTYWTYNPDAIQSAQCLNAAYNTGTNLNAVSDCSVAPVGNFIWSIGPLGTIAFGSLGPCGFATFV